MSDSTIPGETELLVVGGGPGGYTCALRAAQLGLDVTLVECDAIGGTCLNHGCIPSKALLSATRPVQRVAEGERMGIYADPYVDLAELVGWKDGVVTDLTDGVRSLCRSAGVTLVEGIATLEGPDVASVDTSDATGRIAFDRAVVATGSRPVSIPGFDPADDPVLDARAAMAIESVPPRLVVVGAGYVGLEFATVFARLGVDVTLLEALDDALPAFPDHLVEPVVEGLTDLGVEFQFGRAAREWSRANDGVAVVADDDDSEIHRYLCDRVLVAVGREPVGDTCGLSNVGIDLDESGAVPVDGHCRTEVETVFAVGDATGEPLLAHAASAEGVTAAGTVATELEGTATNEVIPAMTERVVPAVVFTDPEVASVGLSEDAAREAGHDPTVGRFPLSASGRAKAAGDARGFVELIADADGRLVGGHTVGIAAAELAGELALAVREGMSLEAVATTVHAHPTYSEAVMEAAEHALGRAIHRSNRQVNGGDAD
jgi:dihydrolipoamide dehydrogenase